VKSSRIKVDQDKRAKKSESQSPKNHSSITHFLLQMKRVLPLEGVKPPETQVSHHANQAEG
jgi:hypothetical protein